MGSSLLDLQPLAQLHHYTFDRLTIPSSLVASFVSLFTRLAPYGMQHVRFISLQLEIGVSPGYCVSDLEHTAHPKKQEPLCVLCVFFSLLWSLLLYCWFSGWFIDEWCVLMSKEEPADEMRSMPHWWLYTAGSDFGVCPPPPNAKQHTHYTLKPDERDRPVVSLQ